VDEILACKCRPWLRLGRDLLGVKMAHGPVGGITFRGLVHCWWIKGQHVASFLDKCRLRSFCCAIRGKYLFEFEWTKSAKNIRKSGAVGYTAGCPKQRLDVDWFNIGEPCNVCSSPPLCESRSGTNFLGFCMSSQSRRGLFLQLTDPAHNTSPDVWHYSTICIFDIINNNHTTEPDALSAQHGLSHPLLSVS
jgi:hypothetical protein